ncbi:HNH endonuclease signature motif containing protein [Corynebacterium xerosis]|uniref:HNH endonuclease signature motif containing protein n=1 Tax=Corynebacterium xerosis TaxID=1725 RepID=UPI0036557919
MAFDHGAFDDDDEHDHEHDERDDPDRHHDPEEESPASAPAPPPRKRWATERDEPVTNLARARNILDVELAEGVAPAGDDDVDSHAASVATRIGAGKSRAVDYCDVGIMFRRMPRIRDLCRSGAFPLWHLTKMAAAVVAVSDDDIAEVESTFLDYLHPRRDFQALPGIRVFMRELRRMVESVEPIATPPDEDDPKPITGESYSVDNEYPGEYGELRAILRKDRLAEFDATVRAIRDSKIKAGEDCSLGDALMAMCRGDFAGAKVTMNIYVDGDASEDTLQVWLDGAGWLPKHVSGEWIARAHSVRLSADSRTDGYVPTDAQKARVRGRDGGCRFPGCDVPAHKCQIDHVIDFDPANPLGVTATWNMQCLCQHHHNLKTSRHWRAVIHDDGTVTWFDHTGTAFATTVPHGPIAHIGRQTFDQRATRLASTIHGDNLRRMRAEADAAAAMERAELDGILRNHARATAKYERDLAEFTGGPLNSADPDIAAQARALAEAADDGWPCVGDPVWDPVRGAEPKAEPCADCRGRNADDIWVTSPMQGNPDFAEDDWPFDEWVDPEPRVTKHPRTTCRPERRRATIDADPTAVPEPPRPLGPDPTVPF